MPEKTSPPESRNARHLALVTPEPWDAPDPIELACKAAVTHAFCTQSDVDERAAMAKLATLAPAAAGSERWLGDPVVRRVAAFVYGTAEVDPARYGLLRGYVQLVRETRYLVGLARTLVTDGVPVACTEQQRCHHARRRERTGHLPERRRKARVRQRRLGGRS